MEHVRTSRRLSAVRPAGTEMVSFERFESIRRRSIHPLTISEFLTYKVIGKLIPTIVVGRFAGFYSDALGDLFYELERSSSIRWTVHRRQSVIQQASRARGPTLRRHPRSNR